MHWVETMVSRVTLKGKFLLRANVILEALPLSKVGTVWSRPPGKSVHIDLSVGLVEDPLSLAIVGRKCSSNIEAIFKSELIIVSVE